MISSSEEIYRRIFSENGDLYEKKFAEHQKGAYSVLFVMYEGIGAVGGVIREMGESGLSDIVSVGGERGESIFFDVSLEKFGGFFLLNREYLFGVHGDFGTTFFVHEFYHTLGVPNGYRLDENISESEDIMGLGRFRPLESVFLDKDTLKQMQY